MAIRINVWIAKKYTDAEWNNLQSDNFYQKTAETIELAASDIGLSANDGGIYAYRYLGDANDSLLKVQFLQLPQVLFSTPDPENPNAQIFLAKLVQAQITRKNIETMLRACRRLEPRKDPSSGTYVFYDPTLDFFQNISIGISNSAGAPGKGFLLGLDPLGENLTINRYGQVLGDIQSILKALVPVLGMAALIYFLEKEQ